MNRERVNYFAAAVRRMTPVEGYVVTVVTVVTVVVVDEWTQCGLQTCQKRVAPLRSC